MNNVKQFKKYCYGMNVTHPPPPPPLHLAQLLLTTLYIYFMKNWGALKIKNPIVINGSKLFEES
jgi:hypothetical protein